MKKKDPRCSTYKKQQTTTTPSPLFTSPSPTPKAKSFKLPALTGTRRPLDPWHRAERPYPRKVGNGPPVDSLSEGVPTNEMLVTTIPETNSEFTPEKWCLEYDCFLLAKGLFSGAMLVLRSVVAKHSQCWTNFCSPHSDKSGFEVDQSEPNPNVWIVNPGADLWISVKYWGERDILPHQSGRVWTCSVLVGNPSISISYKRPINHLPCWWSCSETELLLTPSREQWVFKNPLFCPF